MEWFKQAVDQMPQAEVDWLQRVTHEALLVSDGKDNAAWEMWTTAGSLDG